MDLLLSLAVMMRYFQVQLKINSVIEGKQWTFPLPGSDDEVFSGATEDKFFY